MGKVITGMGMSLDGFIEDRNGSIEGLTTDFEELLEAPSFKKMIENAGAAVMGRHVYEMADPFLWATDDYEFQTPLFVLAHTPPEKYPAGNDKMHFIFVTDGIESAIRQAKEAAGDKDVQVIGGAQVIRQLLNAGLCDELQVDLMPVFLGEGLRLFEGIDPEKVKLERVKVEEITAARTSITFRVVKDS